MIPYPTEPTSRRTSSCVATAHRAPLISHPKPHYELGEALGIIDFERAAKLSGSRFSVLRGKGARLARGIVNFFLDRANDAGYTEMAPPFLVTRSTMWSTGQLSKFADAMFCDQDADLFLIPTAEVPLTAFYRDEILPPGSLPQRFAAYSACFRKEAGAAGRDTRGPRTSNINLKKSNSYGLSSRKKSFEALENPDGTCSFTPCRIRIAVSSKFRSAPVISASTQLRPMISRCGCRHKRPIVRLVRVSNCTDFQARRAAIRYRPQAQAKPELAHTLNGSGLAVGRTLVAILENGQQADGSITIPAALVPYAGFRFDRSN